jgi:hypothetical protein
MVVGRECTERERNNRNRAAGLGYHVIQATDLGQGRFARAIPASSATPSALKSAAHDSHGPHAAGAGPKSAPLML